MTGMKMRKETRNKWKSASRVRSLSKNRQFLDHSTAHCKPTLQGLFDETQAGTG